MRRSWHSFGIMIAVGVMLGCASTRRADEAADVDVPQADAALAAYDDLAVLTEALLLVQRHYVEEVPLQKMIYGAIDGMLLGLDPNSSFLPPEPLAELEEETRGSFSGIGVTVGLEKEGVKVIAPVEDSPAFKAGIHAGDTIKAVDGVELSGTSIEEAVEAIRGDKGSEVKVTVKRADGETVDVTLVRDDIKLDSVKGVRELGDGIGYLRITQFNEHAGEDFAQAMAHLKKAEVTELILDLRDNPGGLLESAVAVTEQVLERGAEIVSVRGRDSKRPQQRYEAGPCKNRFTKIPLAVLVNGNSASAAEIMAGALKAHKRAVLVGETTYGKASVQNVVKLALRPDCAVRLTTGYYYTPDDMMIHGKGIAPDVAVPVSKHVWRQVQMRRMFEERPGATRNDMTNTVNDVRDVQLERAQEVLKSARVPNNG
ncbi:MAG TPA: S41 family peptidase [Kiritimatiellia bacterium]|nr:S41 family peptidase [Kiritimatiellia bacterium]